MKKLLLSLLVLVTLFLLGWAWKWYSSGIKDYNRGVYYQQAGQMELAEQQFKIALSRNPDLAEAHINLGVVYLNRGWDEGAEASTQKGIGLLEGTQTTTVKGSTSQEVLSLGYNNLGAIELNRYVATILQLDTNSAEAHRQKALTLFNQAVTLDPSNSFAQGNIQRLKTLSNEAQY